MQEVCKQKVTSHSNVNSHTGAATVLRTTESQLDRP